MVIGNVGAVIADPFQILAIKSKCTQELIMRGSSIMWSGSPRKSEAVVPVDIVVGVPDIDRRLDVLIGVGVEHLFQMPRSDLCTMRSTERVN